MLPKDLQQKFLGHLDNLQKCFFIECCVKILFARASRAFKETKNILTSLSMNQFKIGIQNYENLHNVIH